MDNKLAQLMNKIEAELAIFNEDSKKAAEKENKAAARRARGATNELTKLFKEYRKMSVELIG